ncbi:MAG: ribosome maturation factor RimP [Parvularculaceae bacterium]
MTPLEKRIETIIAPVIAATGFELVRVRITGSRRKTVQVMAERPDRTMTAEDCAMLSRALSPALDEAGPIGGAYTLEVSSPGIDRPLTRAEDFDEWRGFEARLELNRTIEGRKRFRGVLAGVENDQVAFDIEGEEETAFIPLAWIANAKLVLTDDLVRESLKAAEAAPHEKETSNGDHQ